MKTKPQSSLPGPRSLSQGAARTLRRGQAAAAPGPGLCRSHSAIVIVAIVLVCALGGCATAPPTSRQVSADPLLERKGGVMLLVDACVQINTLGSGDYFVINEAKAGGQAVAISLRKYLDDNNISLSGEVVSVCDARLNRDDSPVLAADSVGGPTRQAPQPLWVPESVTNDAQYVSALRVVSTYAFERAAATASKPGAGGSPSPANNAPPIIGMDKFHSAAQVIKEHTQASSVLFMGVLGKSRTKAHEIAQNTGGFLVGMATAIATAGLGTGVYAWFIPGHEVDGMQMEGALIDLESGQLTWSNAVRVPKDPIDPKNMANADAIDLLFHNIVFKTVPVQSAASSIP